MQFVSPLPFQEALDKLGDKSIIGSALSSSEWSDVPLELRDRAFFSSRVESIQQLQQMKNLITDFLAGNRLTNDDGTSMLKVGSRSAFVDQMQRYLSASGIDRTTGDIHDITSQTRLGLIFDTQTKQSQSYGYWKQGMDPDVLDAFPAMRFIRERDVKEPRQSHEQYQDQVYLKTDPIWWLVINKDFGVPWAPWGWGCGHDVEDVDRPEAEKLHLLKPGERITAPKLPFNHNLGSSIKRMDPDLVDKLRQALGNQIEIKDGMMRWTPKASAGTQPATPSPVPVPKPVPAAPAAPRPSLEQILADVGLGARTKATPELMGALREALREENPVSQASIVKSVTGTDPSGNMSDANLRQLAQDFLNFFPPELVRKLPRLSIIAGKMVDARGSYTPETGLINLNYKELVNAPDQLRKTFFHELMHWIHMEGTDEYRALIFAHFKSRTAGEKVASLPGYGSPGLKDDWYEAYAGKLYYGMKYGQQGLEVPTRYIEFLAMDPDDMAELWNRPNFRETMQIVLQALI